MTLREAITSLVPADMQRLMVAFNNLETDFVKINVNEFVGVNVNDPAKFQILETKNSWAYGKLI